MRFAWLKKNSAGHVSGKQATGNRRIRMAYNLAWWIPILLTFIGTIDYRTGFVAFAAITVVRLVANLYMNNVLDPGQAESFPFRM